MTVSFKASLDNASWKATLAGMDGKKMAPAVARALNKTATSVRKDANALIREERNLSSTTVRNAMVIAKATKGNLQAAVIASGRPVPLREFRASPAKRGVSVAVVKGKRKLIGEPGRRAFLVGKYGNHVFQREGSGRTPIKKLFGPSIPTAFVKEKVATAMLKTAGEVWPKRMVEELNYALNVAKQK